MIVRGLDNNHDWTFGHGLGNGLGNYLDYSDAIAQCVKTKLLSLKNDWFLNRNDGIAWFDYLTKNPNTRQLEIDVKTEVFKVDGVISIDSFDILLDTDTREFLIQISYTDKYNNSNEASFNVTDNR